MSAPNLIRLMIVEDLGYCCEAGFFRIFKQTAVIADRLGVTTRAVQKHKALVRNGCMTCESRYNCLKAKGVLSGYRPLR